MLRICARVSVVALAFAITLPPSPSLGLGLRVGPLYLRLPLPGIHHRRDHAIRSYRTKHEASPANSAALTRPPESEIAVRSPALLNPTVGWAPVYAGIFSPAGASWPFGFATVFDAAFANDRGQAAQLCQDNGPDDLIGRIGETTRPSAAQREALQQLTAAVAQARGYLRSMCPRTLPETPIARLQHMEGQIDTMLMALEIVRLPLQQFEQSLSADQRKRLHAAFAGRKASECAADAGEPKWPIEAIGQAVQPGDAQRQALTQALTQALADVEAASVRAAKALAAGCESELPATPLARLEAVEARLDATWRAVQTMHVALAQFYKGLSEDQRKRFDALNLAALRQQG